LSNFPILTSCPLALNALARLAQYPIAHLRVLGEGPMTKAWKRLSVHLQVDHLVTWHEGLRLSEALAVMSSGHVLLHTSLAEATSAVILEVLSLGLPVVCHDVSGMGIAIDHQCGIKVVLSDPETSIQGFAQAIVQLASNRELYHQLSKGAIERAPCLSWDAKVRRFREAYLAACSREEPSAC
jgi:glycosyltransferase involved in cell wall biosynthesis